MHIHEKYVCLYSLVCLQACKCNYQHSYKLNSPLFGCFIFPPYFTHDASCIMLNIDWTPLDKAIWFRHPNYNPHRAQKLISSSTSRHLSTATRNISSKSVHTFLSNLANTQTDRQTDRQTNAFTSSFIGGNNTKLVHWPLMGGLLHLVQRGGAWAGCGPAQSPPRCTKCNSPPINGQRTNHCTAV